VTFLKLTELAVDGEHIPRLPVNEPEVPESHILQQKDYCPPHVVVECLLVGIVSLLTIEGEKKVDHPIHVEKEHNLDDDDGQQGLQCLRTWGGVRQLQAYIGSGLLPDFTPLVLGCESEGCADHSSDYDDAMLDPLGEIDNPRFLALCQVYHRFHGYQYEDEGNHKDHDL